jgi:8-oxo-dGTP pyrophosphatase MutT (NUDIX family)
LERGRRLNQAQFYTDQGLSPRTNRPRRTGVAVALFSEGEVLLEYRSDSDYWGFISGGVEDGESVLAATLREINEETSGATSSNLKLYAIYSNPGRITAYPDGNVSQIITLAFVGDLSRRDIHPSEESRELRFFQPSQLAGLPIAPTHVDFARDLVTGGRTRESVLVD